MDKTIYFYNTSSYNRARSLMDMALDFGSKGCRFESCRARYLLKVMALISSGLEQVLILYQRQFSGIIPGLLALAFGHFSVKIKFFSWSGKTHILNVTCTQIYWFLKTKNIQWFYLTQVVDKSFIRGYNLVYLQKGMHEVHLTSFIASLRYKNTI